MIEQIFDENLQQVLSFVKQEESIRFVSMNGSRVNMNVKPDIMQDYDVVFFFDDLSKNNYRQDEIFISRFGEPVVIQQNDFEDGSYIIMMQFDKVRYDLRFCDIKNLESVLQEDTLTLILVDKDNRIKIPLIPDDSKYKVGKPSKQGFEEILNELWWMQPYIMKGIYRDEMPYAKYMYDVVMMEALIQLLSIKVGYENNWQVNVGKCGRWLKNYLDKATYATLLSLYPKADYDDMYQKLIRFGQFVRLIGVELAEKLGYEYPMTYDIRVGKWNEKVWNELDK